jgi:anti-sigma B factor antagonist
VPVILTIEQKQLPPDITVLEMSGRIIMGNNSRDVELKLGELLVEGKKKVIFDLAGVTMLDSTGVGILVVSQAKIKKEGGELRICGATGIVEEILKMTSVDKIVRFFPTVAEAASNF